MGRYVYHQGVMVPRAEHVPGLVPGKALIWALCNGERYRARKQNGIAALIVFVLLPVLMGVGVWL